LQPLGQSGMAFPEIWVWVQSLGSGKNELGWRSRRGPWVSSTAMCGSLRKMWQKDMLQGPPQKRSQQHESYRTPWRRGRDGLGDTED
jgi:hypothetical protein